MDATLDTAVDPALLPADVGLCHAMIRSLLDRLTSMGRQIEVLEYKLGVLLRARFGQRAEKLDPNQLKLFVEQVLAEAAATEAEVEEPVETERAAVPRKGHGRRRPPRELPVKEVVLDVPEADRLCACCGKPLVKIGEETASKMDYIPASLYVLRQVRPKYACPHCQEGGVLIAEAPRQAIEKGLPGVGLLAQVIVSKYCDHLPLNRMEHMFLRLGAHIPRSTMCDWMGASARLLRPVYDLMGREVLSGRSIHTDDTPVPVLDRDLDRTRQGRLWAYVGDALHPYTVYDFTPNRRREGPATFLGDYEGYLQADAYGGYDGIYATDRVIEVLCWAHARRKFFDAQDSDRQRAMTAMAYIRQLYDVERAAMKAFRRQEQTENARPLSAIRLAMRQEHSVPILAVFERWLRAQTTGASPVLPKSPLGLAINYMLPNWAAFMRYTTDGDLDIDNNAAERAERPVAIGRKNYLFFGSDNGGRTAAVLYSLVASAKRHGLDPFAYLRDVIQRISDQPTSRLEEFLPDRWKLAQLRAAAGQADSENPPAAQPAKPPAAPDTS